VFEVGFLQIEQMMLNFILPFFRIAAFMMAMPIISSNYTSRTIRLGFAVAFSMALVPVLPPAPPVEGLSVGTMVLVLQQIAIGVALGFTLQVMFQVFAVGGQMIANQMGLGFASVSDPANGVNIVVVGQFYMMLAMMLFITLNGHLVMFEILADSFTVMPLDAQFSLANIRLYDTALLGGWMFASGTLMALPAVTSLLIVNMAFGVMSKAAPQLNIIAIGFPFTMTFGLLITWLSMSGFAGQFERFNQYILQFIQQILIPAS